MDVRRIVPVIRKQLGFGRSAAQQHGKPHAPVPEIGKRHDHPPADAQHFVQNLERPVRLLQRLAKDDVIERLVRVVREPFVDVALIDRYAARDRAPHAASGDLDAAGVHSLVLGQPLQQLAFAAAQIEHLGVRLDNFPDDGVIAAPEEFGHEGRFLLRLRGHCTFSYVLPRKPRMRSVCSATSTRNASCP